MKNMDKTASNSKRHLHFSVDCMMMGEGEREKKKEIWKKSLGRKRKKRKSSLGGGRGGGDRFKEKEGEDSVERGPRRLFREMEAYDGSTL